jgi:hypothetical protein
VDLKEEAALGPGIDGHWYYVSKSLMVETHVQGQGLRVVDVGAGSGWFSRRMLQRGIASSAICVDPGYAEDSEHSVGGRRLSFRRSVDCFDADLVLLMDILEHVEDDIALLSSYARRAAAGTQFLITVPAFSFLWSAHDVYLEHKRRYTLPALLKVVDAAGLKVESSHYYFRIDLSRGAHRPGSWPVSQAFAFGPEARPGLAQQNAAGSPRGGTPPHACQSGAWAFRRLPLPDMSKADVPDDGISICCIPATGW